MMMSDTGGEIRLSLNVYPGAAKNEVVSFTDDLLRIKIAAPPLKGKANRELVAFLSKYLGVGKGNINIIKGHTSRNKIIAINGISQEELRQRLSSV